MEFDSKLGLLKLLCILMALSPIAHPAEDTKRFEKHFKSQFAVENYHWQNDYKLFSSNSNLNNSEVILIGEIHKENYNQQSKFLQQYVKEGDIILLEGFEKGKNLENLIKTDKRFNGINQKNKKINIYGTEDKKTYQETLKHLDEFVRLADKIKNKYSSPEDFNEIKQLREKVYALIQKRDEIFLKEINKHMKKEGKIYFITGSGHVTEGRIITELEKNGIKYTALIPIKNESSKDKVKEYINRKYLSQQKN